MSMQRCMLRCQVSFGGSLQAKLKSVGRCHFLRSVSCSIQTCEAVHMCDAAALVTGTVVFFVVQGSKHRAKAKTANIRVVPPVAMLL